MHLTGDSSVAENKISKEVAERVKFCFEMEDPSLVTDVRYHNGRVCQYELFFEKCKEYLSNTVEGASDDRSHDKFTHQAAAISVRDFRESVQKMCPPDTPILSEQWIRLQFVHKVPSSVASLQYTGKLNVKYAVQSRQFRKEHLDSHYASAIFRYEKGFAVQFRGYTSFPL